MRPVLGLRKCGYVLCATWEHDSAFQNDGSLLQPPPTYFSWGGGRDPLPSSGPKQPKQLAGPLGSPEGLSFLPPFCSSRITVLPSGVLQIYSVEPKDAGSYRCVATTVVGRRRSGEAKLTVAPGIQKMLLLFEHCCQQTLSPGVTGGNGSSPKCLPPQFHF